MSGSRRSSPWMGAIPTAKVGDIAAELRADSGLKFGSGRARLLADRLEEAWSDLERRLLALEATLEHEQGRNP